MDEGGFRCDRRTQRAVVQCIEVIGEASRMVSEPTRPQVPAGPWEQIGETGAKEVWMRLSSSPWTKAPICF